MKKLIFVFFLSLFWFNCKAQIDIKTPVLFDSTGSQWSLEFMVSSHLQANEYFNFHGYANCSLSEKFFLRFGFSKSLNNNRGGLDSYFEGLTVTNQYKEWSNYQFSAQFIYYFGEYRKKNYFIALGPVIYSGKSLQTAHYHNLNAEVQWDENLDKEVAGIGITTSGGFLYNVIGPLSIIMETGINYIGMWRTDDRSNSYKSSSDEGWNLESFWVRAGLDFSL
jgi:hypothetical protein